MADSDANRALLGAYRNGIMRYQKLLKTHVTEVERDYIKERLSACRAAVKALIGTGIDLPGGKSSARGGITLAAFREGNRLKDAFRRLQTRLGDQLLTALTIMLAILLFVIAPLQAAGVVAAHYFGFAFGTVLLAAVFVVSGSWFAVASILLAITLVVVATVLRLRQPSAMDIFLDAVAWLIAGLTLTVVVARAVFASGKVTFHRVIGAVLLYLNIGVIFAALFTFVATLALALGATLATPSLAQKQYDTGAGDTEIKVGQTIPLSGPASAYGSIGKVQAAYIHMINEQGGINGRKINLIQYDDAHNPPKRSSRCVSLLKATKFLPPSKSSARHRMPPYRNI
jgi:hypothetical protein